MALPQIVFLVWKVQELSLVQGAYQGRRKQPTWDGVTPAMGDPSLGIEMALESSVFYGLDPEWDRIIFFLDWERGLDIMDVDQFWTVRMSRLTLVFPSFCFLEFSNMVWIQMGEFLLRH